MKERQRELKRKRGFHCLKNNVDFIFMSEEAVM